MNTILKNIVSGLKIAFFMPCNAEDFRITWDTLWAIIFIVLGLQISFNYIQADQSAKYSEWGIYFHAATFSMLMLSGYLISIITKNKNKILHFVIPFYNAILPLLFLNFIWAFDAPENLVSKVKDAPIYLMTIWSFLIGFRVITLHHYIIIERKILASCFAATTMYILLSHTYMTTFFYDNGNDETEYVQSKFEKLNDEEIFAMQDPLLQKSFENISPSKKGKTDIYAISFGSYAYQDVFMKEVNYVDERLDKKLAITNRIKLINNEATAFDLPMANGTNLKKAITEIESISQPDEDILLLYFTSHGGKTSGLSVNIGGGHSLKDLNGERLSEILDSSTIKHKVIIISSCYSGALIPHLKNENTMIITASADNKQSYGCSDDADLTYFADAYFKKSLSMTTDLEKAFQLAKTHVLEREKRENLTPASNPQIFIGKNIKATLKKYNGAPLITPDEQTKQ